MIFTVAKTHVHYLDCQFLGARGNVPIIAGEFRWNQSTIVTGDRASSQSDLADIGIATTHVDCPPMAVYERRFESFLTLPYDYPKGAEELAVAGFYYLGERIPFVVLSQSKLYNASGQQPVFIHCLHNTHT